MNVTHGLSLRPGGRGYLGEDVPHVSDWLPVSALQGLAVVVQPLLHGGGLLARQRRQQHLRC